MGGEGEGKEKVTVGRSGGGEQLLPSAMASAAEAIDQAAHTKAVDESLWWDSFVILLEQLEGAPVSTYGSPSLVTTVGGSEAISDYRAQR